MKRSEAAGVRITPTELASFPRRELLPKPRRVHLGGRRGTQSVYPWGTSDQLYALCRARKKYGPDYDRIGWSLWIDGFSVGERYWRTPLQNASNKLVEIAQFVSDLGDDGEQPIISEKAILAFETASTARNKSNAMGRIRRRLRRTGFQTALRLIFEVLIGIFRPSCALLDRGDGKDERFVLARVLGTEPAKNKRKQILPPTMFPVAVDAFEKILVMITEAFLDHRGRGLLSVFSDDEVFEARFELTMLLDILCSMERVERDIYGRSSPALDLLASITRGLGISGHAIFLLFWLVARRIPPVGGGARQLLMEFFRSPELDQLSNGY